MLPSSIRALRLAAALTTNYLTYSILWLKRFGYVSLADRARWMHHSCRRVTRALRLSLQVQGPTPTSGLIVSNHLGYLDILAFASAAPCLFVAKLEVRTWPIFGALAGFGGTLFVNRDSGAAVRSVSRQIEAAFRAGMLVVLFPEGTSTDGSRVLPFFPSLLEPAIQSAVPITAAAIGYHAPSHPESAFCYYGRVRFLPHLRSMLRIPHASVLLHFSPTAQLFTHRKQAAPALRQRTLALRSSMQPLQSALPSHTPSVLNMQHACNQPSPPQ